MKPLALAALLSLTAATSQAQDSTRVRNTIWASPAEAFYKQQVGYERLLNDSYSLGIQGANYSGFNGRYKGWNVTVLGRRYVKRQAPWLRKQAPFGLYYQVQAAVYQHDQHLTIYAKNGRQDGYAPIDYRWRGLGVGGGAGLGYRTPILRQAFSNHLSMDIMLGVRYYAWPKSQYNEAEFEERSFLGGDFDWYMAGPGSWYHGLLAVGYSF
ncbi:hypothetical protein LGH70_14955 [Hymenobacter sp. BT635]|uniref:DUF3575 domain-containing protein n=1 Tax=Hymenobacter nitidus TaxID=2880929 RepID=A0ABS8AFM4_9BACT|nr:hypothetical protein [Hymenobacter nitidus]MCB2378899.1 hypothetical protein [Hymenobacter nitidus]